MHSGRGTKAAYGSRRDKRSCGTHAPGMTRPGGLALW